jgi:hypothetical protein
LRVLARGALRDGESIRDEEVSVAAEAAGVGGREGARAMAIAAARARGRGDRRVGPM